MTHRLEALQDMLATLSPSHPAAAPIREVLERLRDELASGIAADARAGGWRAPHGLRFAHPALGAPLESPGRPVTPFGPAF